MMETKSQRGPFEDKTHTMFILNSSTFFTPIHPVQIRTVDGMAWHLEESFETGEKLSEKCKHDTLQKSTEKSFYSYPWNSLDINRWAK